MATEDFEDKSFKCDKCGDRTMDVERYKDKQFCGRCYKRAVEYEADSFRKKHDIRFKDPKTLTWYQKAQLNEINRVVDKE